MDKKISQLSNLSTPSGTDVLPVVHLGTTMGVTNETLFSSIPGNVGYNGIQLSKGTPDSVASASALSLITEVTYVSNGSGTALSMTLANGTHGQQKIVVCTQADHPINLTTAQGGFTNIQFTAVNQTVTLRYLTNKWYIMGSYGVTIT